MFIDRHILKLVQNVQNLAFTEYWCKNEVNLILSSFSRDKNALFGYKYTAKFKSTKAYTNSFFTLKG